MKYNGASVSSSYSANSKQLKIGPINTSGNKNFEFSVEKGLQNPPSGPYSYSNLILEIQNSKGAAIDTITITN